MSSDLLSVSSSLSDKQPIDDIPSLWKSAYEIFQKQEPDLAEVYNKQLLYLGNSPATEDISSRQCAEIALKQLLDNREKKQWKISFPRHDIRIREQVERLLEFHKWSRPLVNAALGAEPFTALAWSGVSLLLPLLASSTTQNESMLKGFNAIGDLQIYWKACEETCFQPEHRQEYQYLLEPLMKLYSHVFAYQAHVICHYSKAQPTRAWKNITNSSYWSEKLDEIEVLSRNCSQLIDLARARTIQQSRDNQMKELQKLRIIQENLLQRNEEHDRDEKETKLLQALAVASGDYERYKNLNPHKVDGTCEWFLTDKRFHDWRNSSSSSLLWVSAGPGCGKSVLSKSLIDGGHLAMTTMAPSFHGAGTSIDSTICYFFFKEGGDGHMDSAQALCALLHQLFTHPSTSGLIKYALPSHREHGATLTSKFPELWRILLDCLTASDAGDVIWVIDALDECREDSRQEFIKTLNKFYSRSETLSTASSKLKFLITSRPYSDLENSFRKFEATMTYLRFDGDEKSQQIRQEIDLVIDARLNDFTEGFSLKDQQKISESLKSIDHRTYLWLHLTLNIIENSPYEFGKRSDIEKLLSHLPSQVSDAYERILSRSRDQSRTTILFQIMLAAMRPLTLDEANIALTLALREQLPESYAEVKEDLWPRDKFRSIVTNLCGLFVSIYDGKLSFIHQTAREFLLDSKGAGNWRGRFTMPQSHGTMTQTCVFQLLMPDISALAKDGITCNEQNPYVGYAASYWPLHFVSQEATSADKFRTYARILCDTSGHQANIWAPTYFRQKPNVSWGSWFDLNLASYLGLREVVHDILFKEEPPVDLEAKGHPYGRTALSWACMQANEDTVELLLCKGADMETTDNVSRTPLLWAARLGHEAIVRLLLENGADINARDCYDYTALVLAAGLEQEAVVELLLENGADTELKTFDNQTALSLATRKGYEAIVKLLQKGTQTRRVQR